MRPRDHALILFFAAGCAGLLSVRSCGSAAHPSAGAHAEPHPGGLPFAGVAEGTLRDELFGRATVPSEDAAPGAAGGDAALSPSDYLTWEDFYEPAWDGTQGSAPHPDALMSREGPGGDDLSLFWPGAAGESMGLAGAGGDWSGPMGPAGGCR